MANRSLQAFGYVPDVPNPASHDDKTLLRAAKGTVAELKAHVKLAHVFHKQDEYENASKEFQAACGMYRDWMTDDDRGLQVWAEYCDKLSLPRRQRGSEKNRRKWQ
ncbi:hypothetical protein D9758_005968 [Tetrapyrgos nigripes]|uniref:Uncharacterized protein n=1 Tax=Tetrapyrgos nigripes TaxID=182062 RepID=A0A8H5G324_9AGAR|nr:hypothetical protein D9758_005968 [Tetrapyrgos nigripes]